MISACATSMHRKAKKLLEGEAYFEAASTYEQILRDKPDDADAIIGLKNAREKIIDTNLITIRMARMADNKTQSLDMLLDIVLKEIDWQLYPIGAVAFTQEEETRFAIDYIKSEVSSALSSSYPLKANIFLKKYDIIVKAKNAQISAVLHADVNNKGKESCQNLLLGGLENYPYYAEYVHKYCNYWSENSGLESKVKNKANELFKNIILVINVEGLPQELTKVFENNFQAALQQTAWYNVNGQLGIAVILEGKFLHDRKTNLINRVHEYSVKIPYTVNVPVLQSKRVPYQGFTTICTYRGQQSNCWQQAVTKYRTESYTINMPVTRYREEARSFEYQAYKHNQYFGLTLNGVAMTGTHTILLEHTKEFHEEGVEHNVNMPSMGLYPKTAYLTTTTDWLNKRSKEITSSFEKKLSDLWVNL